MARKNNMVYRAGTDVNIFKWNVDKYFDGMWDKIYCTLTGGCDDTVDTSKGWLNVYDDGDIGVCPGYWDRHGFDGIVVYQPTKDLLKFAESLAKKYHLDFEYKDVHERDGSHTFAVVIYIPQNADCAEYLQYEPEAYQQTFKKSDYDKWKSEKSSVTVESFSRKKYKQHVRKKVCENRISEEDDVAARLSSLDTDDLIKIWNDIAKDIWGEEYLIYLTEGSDIEYEVLESFSKSELVDIIEDLWNGHKVEVLEDLRMPYYSKHYGGLEESAVRDVILTNDKFIEKCSIDARKQD